MAKENDIAIYRFMEYDEKNLRLDIASAVYYRNGLNHFMIFAPEKDPSVLWPVIEKIESMGYQFKLCRRKAEIWIDGSSHPDFANIPAGTEVSSDTIKPLLLPLHSEKLETKLASAYACVVWFIDNIVNKKDDSGTELQEVAEGSSCSLWN